MGSSPVGSSENSKRWLGLPLLSARCWNRSAKNTLGFRALTVDCSTGFGLTMALRIRTQGMDRHAEFAQSAHVMTNEPLAFPFIGEDFRRFLIRHPGGKSAVQDDRELVGHGDQRHLAALYTQSPKPFLQRGVLLRGCGPGAFHQGGTRPAIAARRGPAFVPTGTDAIAGRNSDPGAELTFAREHAHVNASFRQ